MKVTYTHKGWFGICPCYFARLDSAAPNAVPRHWCFEPLMLLSEWVYQLLFFLRCTVDPDYVPQWPLQVTGKLQPPRTIDHPGE